MDRLFSMTVFVKAVELGSFSAAADALQMSPQLVGKNVRMLEQHLGVRLLNRTTRSQHLTEIGATFYDRARNILAEMEMAEGLAAQTTNCSQRKTADQCLRDIWYSRTDAQNCRIHAVIS